MAIKNVAGHGVSSVAPQHHQQVTASQPKFAGNTGAAGHMGISAHGSKGGFPGAKGSKKSSAPAPNKSVSSIL